MHILIDEYAMPFFNFYFFVMIKNVNLMFWHVFIQCLFLLPNFFYDIVAVVLADLLGCIKNRSMIL